MPDAVEHWSARPQLYAAFGQTFVMHPVIRNGVLYMPLMVMGDATLAEQFNYEFIVPCDNRKLTFATVMASVRSSFDDICKTSCMTFYAAHMIGDNKGITFDLSIVKREL